MAWLTSLLKKPEAVEEDIAVLEPEPVAEAATSGPQLAVLVPDMAGISSFRLRMLPTAPSAEEHIAALRADVRHDTHAFWALQEKPIVDESAHVEALVLIRAQSDSDLVYVVSFLDIESAMSFTRFEVRRGLYLGNVMIYWAAFAQIREELEGVTIQPHFAPPTENYIPPAFATQAPAPATQPEASIATVEAAPEPEVVTSPQPETPVEAEARQAVERYLRKQEARRASHETPQAAEPPAEEERKPIQLPPNIIESAAAIAAQPFEERSISLAPEFADAEPEPVAEAAPEVEASVIAPEPEPIVLSPAAQPIIAEPKPETEPEPELMSEVAEEQAAIDEALVFQHRAVPAMKPRNELQAQGEAAGMIVDQEREPLQVSGEMVAFGGDDEVADSLSAGLAVAEPEPAVETIPGDEEIDFDRAVPIGVSADPAAGLPTTKKMDDFDIAYEVERLLRHRRWEQKDSPFNGFKSPPGRF